MLGFLRSPLGAHRWWTAFEEAAKLLIRDPHSHGFAPENGLSGLEIRQFLFKTPQGRIYRGVYTTMENKVRILRVRGPGQPPPGSKRMKLLRVCN